MEQPSSLEQHVAAVRQFNRAYTRQIGLLEEKLNGTDFSLTESRVLYELANRNGPAAADLSKDLGIDPGYLSRILQRFAAAGLVTRTPSANDGRQNHIELTSAGGRAFAPVDRRSKEAVAAMLQRLSEAQQARLAQAMTVIERLIAPGAASPVYGVRQHRAGDMGWVVSRHGALYGQEYGWNLQFEAMVAEIVAAFIRQFDQGRERCFIAELSSEPVGSAFVVRQSQDLSKLRLLLVEPHARGLGIGKRLVDECVSFARAAGYRKMMLWTQDVLEAARHIYKQSGFQLVKQEPNRMFGPQLIGETWELVL